MKALYSLSRKQKLFMARTSLICSMFVVLYFLSFAKICPFFQSPIQFYSWLDLNHDKLSCLWYNCAYWPYFETLSDYKALPMPLLVIISLACTKAII